MLRYLLLATTLMLAGCATTADRSDQDGDDHSDADVEFLNPPAMKAANLPFSDAVRVGNLLFLSGKLGNIPGTLDLAQGGIQGETRQTMENISMSLQRNGATMDQVVKCTVFLADMAEWGAMNAVYAQFFPNNKPTRSAVGVNGLALNARVEIECIAAID